MKNKLYEFTCEKSIAYDSPDHQIPTGTRSDNSTNPRFNYNINALFKRSINILDIGCAGGGFVHDCINDGHLAIGLEGSDYSKKHQRASWPIISDYLHTCDVTEEFNFVNADKRKLLFDLVTAWELFEHIKTEKLDIVLKNVTKHTHKDTILIFSICPFPDYRNGIALHQTVKQKTWWLKKFSEYGLFHNPRLAEYFQKQYIRGGKKNDASFVVVLTTKNTSLRIPTKNWKSRLIDFLYGGQISWLLGQISMSKK